MRICRKATSLSDGRRSVNTPEVAILGSVAWRNEAGVGRKQCVPRLTLPLSLSHDHRVTFSRALCVSCRAMNEVSTSSASVERRLQR
jgi:pyruvate/2-oxoglutarate dehydrogenase complex dihydrolipoamide acyltransferase (E2) component